MSNYGKLKDTRKDDWRVENPGDLTFDEPLLIAENTDKPKRVTEQFVQDTPKLTEGGSQYNLKKYSKEQHKLIDDGETSIKVNYVRKHKRDKKLDELATVEGETDNGLQQTTSVEFGRETTEDDIKHPVDQRRKQAYTRIVEAQTDLPAIIDDPEEEGTNYKMYLIILVILIIVGIAIYYFNKKPEIIDDWSDDDED